MRSYWIIRHPNGRPISTPFFQTFTGRPWNNDSVCPLEHTRRRAKDSAESKVLSAEPLTQNSELRTQNSELRTQNSELRNALSSTGSRLRRDVGHGWSGRFGHRRRFRAA